MIIILIGLPGTGKGTQAKKIINYYKIEYISVGELFRKYIDKTRLFGRKLKKYLKFGKLVPDFLTIQILQKKILNFINKNKKNILIDGFPRTLKQAKILEKFLFNNNLEINFVINIELKNDLILKRLYGRFVCSFCGAIYNKYTKIPLIKNICDICKKKNVFLKRNDDNINSIKKRLVIGNKNNIKILNYYKKKKKLFNINGNNLEEIIFLKIKKILNCETFKHNI